MPSYQYRKLHCGDKTILRPSYLHNGISYTGKTTSLYWIRAQADIWDVSLEKVKTYVDGRRDYKGTWQKSSIVWDMEIRWIRNKVVINDEILIYINIYAQTEAKTTKNVFCYVKLIMVVTVLKRTEFLTQYWRSPEFNQIPEIREQLKTGTSPEKVHKKF